MKSLHYRLELFMVRELESAERRTIVAMGVFATANDHWALGRDRHSGFELEGSRDRCVSSCPRTGEQIAFAIFDLIERGTLEMTDSQSAMAALLRFFARRKRESTTATWSSISQRR